ncbi:MAG: hyaluronate lyase [Thermofilum sp.]|jgi:hydrogenase small subunit|uniref:NADH-quinone oxidoreductase subunit B family protein n=1 Tax=Thermofilum sp. TaxID=1961369 RepID=UPI00258376D8|nr:hyaluronate lyase [Thermofilum sp.]MCI4409879.1 hyaluronate lyase [Thermofilum sp.]
MTNLPSISRRDFVKLAGSTAFLASLNWDELVRLAVAQAQSGSINIVWFEAQDCAGNTTALIQATEPDLIDVLGGSFHLVGPGNVKLAFHETVMPEWGEGALDILRAAVEGKLDPFVLVLEGSFPQDEKAGGPPGSDYYCYIGDENGKPISCVEWMRRLLPRAVAVVAVGNCASYGGLVANKVIERVQGLPQSKWSDSPTGAVGFFDDPIRGIKGLVNQLPEAEPFRKFISGQCSLKPGEIRADCRPAVAVPGCPANGNGQLRTLAALVLWAKGLLPLPELDIYWRPKFIYGATVHEQCPRAGSYAAGDFRAYPGENSYKCLYAVGCKGPISNCPWNKLGWVNGVGGPTRTGGVCIGCTMPGFTDAYEPFYKPLQAPRVPSGLEGAAAVAALLAGVGLAYWTSKNIEKKKEEATKEVKG